MTIDDSVFTPVAARTDLYRDEALNAWRIRIPERANIALDTVAAHARGPHRNHAALVFEDDDATVGRAVVESATLCAHNLAASSAMDPLDIFSVRDLRQRSGELLKGAESGRLAIVTKHGRPAIVAVPLDSRLMELGVHRALALHLFEKRQVTLAQAAKVACVPVEEFIELLGAVGIPAVDYPPEELNDEISAAS